MLQGVEMNDFIIACATDEGQRLIDRHFGDAGRYDLYELKSDSVTFLRSVVNTAPEEKAHEESHGDPEKAQNIGGLLRPFGVQVLVSGQFGQNLKRVKRSFVPVIVRKFEIAEVLQLLQINFDEIQKQYLRGTEKDHIVLRKKIVEDD